MADDPENHFANLVRSSAKVAEHVRDELPVMPLVRFDLLNAGALTGILDAPPMTCVREAGRELAGVSTLQLPDEQLP